MSKCLEFQAQVKPKVVFDEVPGCLAALHDGVNDYVVLEDLSPDGYGTVSRQTGMDFNHCKLALQTLGKMHGLSLVYRHQRPEEFEGLLQNLEVVCPTNLSRAEQTSLTDLLFQETYYSARLKSWYQDFQKNQIEVARHAVSTEYPGSVIEQKMESFFTGDLYDRMVAMTHKRSKYYVIGHGDCWMPNFLFKYGADGCVPTAAKIIDFQLARFASPALDISFFVYSCTSQTLREQHYHDLLKAYHQSASDLIRSFGSNPDDVYPYSGLLDEMRELGCFGVGMGIESVPFSIMDEGCDLDQIKGEEAVPITTVWIIKPIEQKEGRRRLADVFKHAVDVGYL